MAKILLVEDDNNLREIYEARLQAEGYDIVSARDGEEALTVAMKERPDLIISDVMMPKISGFDMLDIIRSTEETKNSKVIMMTALSQAEDKERASKLGADRYLVKSQVTLEDVAKVAREVLEGEANTPPPSVQTAPLVVESTEEPTPSVSPTPAVATESPAPAPTAPLVVESTEEPTPSVSPTPAVATESLAPAPTSAPSVDPAAAVTQADTNDDTSLVTPTTMAPPTDDNSSTSNISDDSAQSGGATSPSGARAEVVALGQSVKDEEKAIAAQIESFIESKKTIVAEPATPTEIPANTPDSNSENLTSTPTSTKASSTPTEPAPEDESPKTTTQPNSVDKSKNTVQNAQFSETTKKKVIQPINDLNASSGPNLDELLKKEEEKEQMVQIAKEISSNPKTNEVADELSAEAALRAAARKPKEPEQTPAPTPEDEVKIGDDGNLEALNPKPVEEPVALEKPADTPQPIISDISESPAIEPANTQSSAPVTSNALPPSEQNATEITDTSAEEQITSPVSVNNIESPETTEINQTKIAESPAPQTSPQTANTTSSNEQSDSTTPTEQTPIDEALITTTIDTTKEQVTHAPQPVIPHSNGTSIDGVSQPPQSATNTTPAQSPESAVETQTAPSEPSKPDPSSIAL